MHEINSVQTKTEQCELLADRIKYKLLEEAKAGRLLSLNDLRDIKDPYQLYLALLHLVPKNQQSEHSEGYIEVVSNYSQAFRNRYYYMGCTNYWYTETTQDITLEPTTDFDYNMGPHVITRAWFSNMHGQANIGNSTVELHKRLTIQSAFITNNPDLTPNPEDYYVFQPFALVDIWGTELPWDTPNTLVWRSHQDESFHVAVQSIVCATDGTILDT